MNSGPFASVSPQDTNGFAVIYDSKSVLETTRRDGCKDRPPSLAINCADVTDSCGTALIEKPISLAIVECLALK